MKTRGQNVRKHSEVADLIHGLVFIREFEQVEIGEGHQDVVRLASYPTAHINVTIRATWLLLIYIEANARVPFTASTAASTGHIKWNGYQVADVEKQHVLALLDDFAQDLVSKHNSFWCGRTAAHHMLVRSANVGRHHLQDDAVFNVLTLGILEDGVVDVVDCHLARTLVYYASIIRHGFLPFTTGTIIVFGCVCGKARFAVGQ